VPGRPDAGRPSPTDTTRQVRIYRCATATPCSRENPTAVASLRSDHGLRHSALL